MSNKIRALKREIERRGGRVGLAPGMPDEVAERFLREILECPHCQQVERKTRETDGAREH